MDYTFTIPASHPSLEGHFPNNSIVPGVVILDEVFSIVKNLKPDLTIATIPMVKFTHPLLAEQIVTIEIKQKNDNALSFNCSHNDIKLVTGQLTLKSKQ